MPEFRQKDIFNEFIVEKGTDPKSFVNIDWIEEVAYDREISLAQVLYLMLLRTS